DNQAAGVFELQNDAKFYWPCCNDVVVNQPVFNNAGVIRKSGGTGTSAFQSLIVRNSGTLAAQTGTILFTLGYTQNEGTTILSGGSLASDVAISINGGILTGSGTIGGSVVNASEIIPGASPGTITINGNYTQSP